MPFYNPAVTSPEAMLASYPLLRALPAELAARGHAVVVLQHAPAGAVRSLAGARYEWIAAGRLARAAGRALDRWKPRYGPAYYEINRPLLRRLRQLRPEVVHLFGLTMDLHLALVVREVRRLGVPLVVHYHGGLPAVRRRHLRLQRHNLHAIDRALFTARDQARPWIDAGLLPGWERVVQVAETSSPFRGLPREAARARTGMLGDPVCLSAGRLHPIKDPLTTLRGFARIAAARPRAQLYLYYLTG
jgi:glycosyltransferase involved in cell wall biosynthesis